MLPAAVAAWRDSGRVVPTTAGELFVRTSAGDGLPVLFLHGFPSSSFDWRFVIAELAGRPTIAFDFLGFGLSAKPRPHRYSLFEQADLVAEVLAAGGVERVDVVAHDMGTSVATELLAREIEGRLRFGIEHVVLGNGSVIIERASLRPIQNVLRSPFGPLASRLSSARMFRREFGALFSTGHRLTRDEADAQWALVSRDDGQRIMHHLIRYIDERIEFAPRWHGAIRSRLGPVDFLWATGDIVATTSVLAGLQELRPGAKTIELDGLGHYPQLEDPVAYTASMLRLLTPQSR